MTTNESQKTFSCTLADGTVATRTSVKPFTHAVLGVARPGSQESVVRWTSSEAMAVKAQAKWLKDCASFGNTAATARIVPVA